MSNEYLPHDPDWRHAVGGRGLSEGLGLAPARATCECCAFMHAATREAQELGSHYAQQVIDQRAEIERLRAELADAKHAMRAYARDNPRHEYQGATQDPNGVHAWLARNDRA